jgi:hypothetical protein
MITKKFVTVNHSVLVESTPQFIVVSGEKLPVAPPYAAFSGIGRAGE